MPECYMWESETAVRRWLPPEAARTSAHERAAGATALVSGVSAGVAHPVAFLHCVGLLCQLAPCFS